MGKISFKQYLLECHDWFRVDAANQKLVDLLSLYCKGLKRFEESKDDSWIFPDQQQLYLDKGILVTGNVGSGKTMLLKMMNKYYGFLERNEHRFRSESVPDLADKFSAHGRASFTDIKKGNWLFDELCFIDERTGKPDREIATYYGDKLLIGSKVIYDRSAIFVETGWKSHYTTNASLSQIKDIYGERVYSRLLEKCNVLVYVGADRRMNSRPHMERDYTARKVIHEIPKPDKRPITITPAQEKKQIQDSFETYISGNNIFFIDDTIYDALQRYGCKVPALDEFMVELRAETPMAGDDILERYAKKRAVAKVYEGYKERGESVLKFVK